MSLCHSQPHSQRRTASCTAVLLGFFLFQSALVAARFSSTHGIPTPTATTTSCRFSRDNLLSFLPKDKTNQPSAAFLVLQRFNIDKIRGGALAAAAETDSDDDSEDDGAESEYDEEDSDEDDDEEEEEEKLFKGIGGDDFETAESDFAEANFVQRVIAAWDKTPPFTKAYLTAGFAAASYGKFMNGNEFPSFLSLEWKAVFKGQIWRPLTAFLNFGPMGLGFFLTAHFIWTYMSTLERLHHAKPYDFWIMIVFGQLCMLIGYPVFKLSPKFLGHNLSTFLVYIWSRFHEGLLVDMFGLFTSKAEMLPWLFLAQTFLLEGEPPLLDFLGIVFGHVYYHSKSVGLLRAPPALVAWYKGDSVWAKKLRSKYREITSDFELV